MTLANGERSTITAITVVPADQTEIIVPTGAAGVSSTTGSPRLQTNAAVPMRVGMVGGVVLGGAVFGAVIV